MDTNLNISLQTFGCKVNSYDSGLIHKNLLKYGFKSPQNVHVLNTCAVTKEATNQAVREIRKIKSKNPDAIIVVTGCSAQVDTGVFEKLPSVDLIIANSHKGLLPQILEKHFKGDKERVFKSNIFKKEDLEAGGGTDPGHSRSFLKIQDGCNSFCTFCIIPYARGKSRSIPIDDLVMRVQEIAAENVFEIVLTGVHIGDYLDETRTDKNVLEDLVENILNRTTVKRLRLSSLEPIEISDRLLGLFQNERLCPHFHMSIQSAETDVLKQMKRKYTSETVRDSLERIRRVLPEAFIGMDVIAGFPTETEEQFLETYKNLSETPWTKLHVFPYSERSGTRAAILDQVPFHVRKERASRLRELSLHRYQSEGLSQVGKIKKSLVLKKPSRDSFALTDNYWPVGLSDSTGLQGLCDSFGGQEVQIKIEAFRPDSLNQEGILVGRIL